MKKAALVLASLVLAACSDVTPTAPSAVNSPSYTKSTAPGQTKLLCFSGPSEGTNYGGSCLLSSTNVATLDNTGGDPDGSYSGVYFKNMGTSGKPLAQTGAMSFSYTGTATAGSPRISFPLSTGGYLFTSAFYCNDGAGNVDVINDPTCTIYTNFSGESFANWAALVAAHPDWISGGGYSFIIADDVGLWTVSNVKLGQPNK